MRNKTYYNGHCFDDEIDGYITLEVSGRNFSSTDLSSKDNVFDGSTYQSQRLPKKTITVSYLLKAVSQDDFDKKHNQLLGYLYKADNTMLYFGDQTDKYFDAIYTSESKTKGVEHYIQATLTFTCLTPYMYSRNTKEFQSYLKDGIRTIDIENEGNLPAEIDFNITFNSPNAYIGVVSEYGALQFGAQNYTDDAKPENTELVTFTNFLNASDDKGGTDPMHPAYTNKGTFKQVERWNRTYLELSTSGYTTENQYNGATRTVTLDEEVGEFVCSFNAMFCTSGQQLGEMNISFLTGDDELVCGVEWLKYHLYSTDADYSLAIGSMFPISRGFTSPEIKENTWLHAKKNNGYIAKKGSRITIFANGKYETFVFPSTADLKVKKIKIAMRQNGTTPITTYMGLCDFSFKKYDIFSTNESVEINGEESMFYEGGLPAQQKEKMGSTYFKAPPLSTTKVQFYWSSWIEKAPTVTATIRERWL